VRIEKLKATYDLNTVLVHFPLHPDTPMEGRELAPWYAQRGRDPEEMYRQMKERMDAEGLPYGRRTHTYNSRLAQELGKWADAQKGGEAIHDLIYKAYFVDARNIGDGEVLVELAGRAGLDTIEARKILMERRFQRSVDLDWQKSAAYGVTGVPTFVAARYGVVGCQPYEALAQLAERAGAVKKA
jgi:predicted DsbA family dithiol-disulfide isomerase